MKQQAHYVYVDIGLFEPANFCSRRTVRFHYLEYVETRALFEIRKQLLSNSAISYEEIKELVKQLWPDNKKGVGRGVWWHFAER